MSQEEDKMTNNLLDSVIDSIKMEDFDSICRVCLKNAKTLISIAEFEIIKMISSCTSIQISLNDNLPSHLCQSCLNELQNAFNFKQLSERSDSNLRKILFKRNLNKNLTIESDSDEIDDDVSKDYDNDFTDVVKYETEIVDVTKIKNEFENESSAKDPFAIETTLIKYECDECDLKFPNRRYLKQHIRSFHTHKEQKCSQCKCIFYNSSDLEKHVKRKHKSNAVTNKQQETKSRTCHICNKVFQKPSKLLCHMVKHSDKKPYQCTECGKAFKLIYTLRTHQRIAHAKGDSLKKLIQCDKCEKKFLFPSSLKEHVARIHDKIQPKHLCTTCGKYYSSRTALERHSVIHKPDRPYQCNLCFKSFKVKSTLEGHVRFVHSSTKNIYIKIPCKICGKQITKGNMHPHLRTHSSNRLVKCDHCPKQFLLQRSLLLHIRYKHENMPRERKYLCNVCGRACDSPALLKNHMLSHSDVKTFECDKCNMKFKSRFGVKHHIKTVHLNMKPYSCTVCSRNFTTKANMIKHVRTHTGERPFQCMICDKSFTTKDILKGHTQLIHTKQRVKSKKKKNDSTAK